MRSATSADYRRADLRAGLVTVGEGGLHVLTWFGDLVQVAFVVLLASAWQLGAERAWGQLSTVLAISHWWWAGVLCGLLLLTALHRALFPVPRWRDAFVGVPADDRSALLEERSGPVERREPRLD